MLLKILIFNVAFFQVLFQGLESIDCNRIRIFG